MAPADRRRRRRRRVALLLVTLGALAFFFGAASWPDRPRGMRPANEQAELFRYVAQELAEPALCARIPWSAESGGGFFLAPSYERSNCYAFIAGRTRNPWLCWRVKRFGAWSLLSHQTSMWSCLLDAWRGMNAGIAVAPASLAGFFATLGYDPDTLHLEGITPALVSVKDVYRRLATQPDIVARIVKVIGASGPAPSSIAIDPTMLAYLADLAALASRDPDWCARIPNEQRLPGQAAPFRDWCLFTLASNTKDARLCDRIPLGSDETDPRLSLRAKCAFQAGSPSGTGQYTPEVPETDDQARALIARLHYDVPHALDLSPEQIHLAYERFLQELGAGTDAAHRAARQRFVERALGVP